MRIVVVTYLVLILFSCKGRKGYVEKNDNNGDNVYSVTSDDDDMNEAIEKAKSTYNQFLEAFDDQEKNTSDYTVKMKFSSGTDDNEHMWLGDLHKKNDKFYGVLDSDPIKIDRVKLGDTIEIRKDSVSDWMYVKNDKMVGGYTILVLYDKMTEAEKSAFRKEISFQLK